METFADDVTSKTQENLDLARNPAIQLALGVIASQEKRFVLFVWEDEQLEAFLLTNSSPDVLRGVINESLDRVEEKKDEIEQRMASKLN